MLGPFWDNSGTIFGPLFDQFLAMFGDLLTILNHVLTIFWPFGARRTGPSSASAPGEPSDTPWPRPLARARRRTPPLPGGRRARARPSGAPTRTTPRWRTRTRTGAFCSAHSARTPARPRARARFFFRELFYSLVSWKVFRLRDQQSQIRLEKSVHIAPMFEETEPGEALSRPISAFRCSDPGATSHISNAPPMHFFSQRETFCGRPRCGEIPPKK